MKVYTGECVVSLKVNNEECSVKVKPNSLLLDVLREQLGLTGAKPGCKNGDCGACTVIMDGNPLKSCLMLTVEAVGHDILTIEGINNTNVQQAFIDASAFQCGYCTSGFLMVAYALANKYPNADEYKVEEWLQSNICRCTCYSEIRQAMRWIIDKEIAPSNSSGQG